MKQELVPVLMPRVGEKYHVSWSSNGVVGVCISIDESNKLVQLRTPKTKILFKNPTKFSDLRHLRKNQHNPH